MTTSVIVHPFPETLTRALNAYRDRCWRGGDPTPERMMVEREIENHVAKTVSAALDRALPLAPDENEVREWLEELAADSEQQAATYGDRGDTTDSDGWAKDARMFRWILSRLYREVPSERA